MSVMFDDKVKAEIIARLDKLTPESKPLWGRMTVTQMLTHMNDAFRIALGMKEAEDKSSFWWRNIVFPMSVYVMPNWPKSTATAPEMNTEKLGSRPRDFYTEQEFLKKMFDIFNEREELKLKPHPNFGKLSKKQWRDLIVKHLNHHLNQFSV